MYDLLNTLRLSNRGREAAVYETLCAAVTGKAYTENWKNDAFLISMAAAQVRRNELCTYDDDDRVSEEEKRNRRVAIQLQNAAKHHENNRKAVVISIVEDSLTQNGWVKTDRMAKMEQDIHRMEQDLQSVRFLQLLTIVILLLFISLEWTSLLYFLPLYI
ncbi:hypothetical protein C8J57DRAFT_15466 [Mycena rebaudengoi]|nr:hypothetical protein C8J57DRAFT_15466 [Mycena rebaudengoi]